jgi:CRISPR-associated protein Cmr1
MTLFAPPTQTTLHYRIVTPMFLGGEHQQADATQFRNASFKGALRFWWRALNWGQAFREATQQTDAALQALHRREGGLFGLASDSKESRQSQVQIHSDLQGATLKQPGMALQTVSYLLGQGLFHFRDGVTRQYLEGGELTIRLSFKPGMAEADIQSVDQAAIALGLLGGLGSRARKGLGSLALQTLERKGQPVREFSTTESIAAFINTLDFSAPGDAPLSAFTQATRIDVSATAAKALEALKAIGDELQLYRGYGRYNLKTKQHEVNGVKARQRFSEDHDKVLAATQGTRLQQLPNRAVFGLPHNYVFSSPVSKLNITTEDEGRRASPLLVHIHPLQDGKFVAIQTLLPGIFLPDGMKIEAKGKSKYAIPECKVDYAHITRYLEGFANKRTLKAPHHG